MEQSDKLKKADLVAELQKELGLTQKKVIKATVCMPEGHWR